MTYTFCRVSDLQPGMCILSTIREGNFRIVKLEPSIFHNALRIYYTTHDHVVRQLDKYAVIVEPFELGSKPGIEGNLRDLRPGDIFFISTHPEFLTVKRVTNTDVECTSGAILSRRFMTVILFPYLPNHQKNVFELVL